MTHNREFRQKRQKKTEWLKWDTIRPGCFPQPTDGGGDLANVERGGGSVVTGIAVLSQSTFDQRAETQNGFEC